MDEGGDRGRLLSLEEIAQYLAVTDGWLRHAMAHEGFPCAVDAGDDVLFDLDEVRAWLRRPDPHGDET